MSPSAGVDELHDKPSKLTKPAAPDAKKHFPMTVNAFFDDADDWLNYGDILLSRSPLMAAFMS